jgi:hypothetical protein
MATVLTPPRTATRDEVAKALRGSRRDPWGIVF